MLYNRSNSKYVHCDVGSDNLLSIHTICRRDARVRPSRVSSVKRDRVEEQKLVHFTQVTNALYVFLLLTKPHSDNFLVRILSIPGVLIDGREQVGRVLYADNLLTSQCTMCL
jgi:hypothetical protein